MGTIPFMMLYSLAFKNQINFFFSMKMLTPMSFEKKKNKYEDVHISDL